MATENGTNGNDLLKGTTGADILNGKAGNDTYTVNHLGDVVNELFNEGIDTINTSVLDALSTYSLQPWYYVENLTYTGTSAAQLKGNTFDNVIKANSSQSVSDTLYGNAGNDTLYGYGGNDSMMGGSGNDTLDGGAGNDNLIGGSGNDWFLLNSTADRAFEYASGGFDTIESSAVKDLRLGWTKYIEGLTYTGSTAASLYGNAQSNVITSESGTNDNLFGYEGNDTLDGGNGTDSMVGSIGDDLYMVSSIDIVKELVDQGTDTFVGTKTDIGIAAYAETIENLFYTGGSDVAVKGNDMNNVVSGGSGDNTVSGIAGDDSLFGGAGKDSLVGGAGEDWLYGGSAGSFSQYTGNIPDTAKDTLNGGTGNDQYQIDNADDVIVEASDGGTLDIVRSTIDNSLAHYGNVEAMVLSESSQAWFGQGSSRSDILVGNQGDNYLVGGSGNDTLSGASNSQYYYSANSDALEGGAGNDALVVFGFNNYYTALDTSLFGGSGNDLYVLGTSDGYIGGVDTGGTDTAVLMGNGSIEALDGVDHIVLYGNGGGDDSRALAAINAIHAAVTGGAGYTGSLGYAYNATGNALANRITGNDYANALNGGDGNDTLIGNVGNDTLDGGAGTDSLVGGQGNDWYYVNGNDKVVESPGEGNDIIVSETLTSYSAFANTEGLQYTGSANVNLKNANDNTTADFFGAGTGNDVLTGFGGNDTLTGGAGNDTLYGVDGNDTLLGGTENDYLYGGLGNDSVLGGSENDYLDGGDGNDTVKGEAGADNLYGGVGNDSIDGGTENDTVYGGEGIDTLQGGDGDDQLYAGQVYYTPDTVKNTLRGGDNNDTITGGDAGDTLSGDAGNDSVIGNAGNDAISAGGAVASTLYYQVGGDVVWGDELYGAGSAGADTISLDAATIANAAVETSLGSGLFYFNTGTFIADFNAASDTIELDKATVGDGDGTPENVLVKETAGGTFAANAEMVFFRGDAAANFDNTYSMSYFSASAVTTAIGNASANFAVGAERIFVVDDGSGSAIFQFTAANADDVVTVDELLLLAVVANNTALVAADFVLG